MKLTVIVPTYNRKGTLETTLLSLNDQTSKDFEVVICDDGSTDGTAELIRSINVNYPITHLWQKNDGRSAARNMGLEKAEGDIILFMDDHIIADKRLIEEHIYTHNKYFNDGVRVVRGRVGFIERAEDAPPLTEYLPEEKIRSPRWENEPFRAFITNNISVEKKALLSVFGFDEDFKEYGLQDAETGYRLHTAGYKFKINPNAVGYIFGVGLKFEERCFRRRQVGRSSVLFYKKHPTLLVKINLSIHIVTLLAQKILSIFERYLPKSWLLFYNFSTGVKEGLVKYKSKQFERFHSRFKGTKRNILFVSHLSDLSGAPISLSLIVKHLNRIKYNPIVALPGPGPITNILDAQGINYQFYKDHPVYHIFPSLKIYQILKDRQIDLLYINTSVSIWAAKVAKYLKTPVISHIREDLTGMNHWLIREKIVKWSDRIILISNWMLSFLSGPRSIVVHNTVDLNDFSHLQPDKIRAEFNIKGPFILYVGTIEERKGVKYLIKAFPKIKTLFPQVKLLIVGNPLPGQIGYLNGLKKLIKDPNLQFIASRRDIYDIMASCDIMCVPSLSEPFGRVIIEAMACGRPVIASNVGGIPEIIEDGKTGILVKPKSLDAISKECTMLLKNREKMKAIGIAARKRVEDHFTTRHQIEQIEDILNEYFKD